MSEAYISGQNRLKECGVVVQCGSFEPLVELRGIISQIIGRLLAYSRCPNEQEHTDKNNRSSQRPPSLARASLERASAADH
jgi:hypothetical protein